MNAVRFGGDRDIGPIVHQYPGPVRIRNAQYFSGQVGQIAGFEIALADLHKINALRDPMGHVRQPSDLVAGKGPVCNEAANHGFGLFALAR